MSKPCTFKGILLLLPLLWLGGACNQDGVSGPGGGDGAGGGLDDLAVVLSDGGAPVDAAYVPDGGVVVTIPDGGSRVCFVATCQGKTYHCGDCLDNDGDGRIDSDDPDCLGPCDNSENSFDPQIPGGNNAPCKQDCFFDQDTGSGNDDCYWDHKCDPLEVAPRFDPEGSQCSFNAATKLGGSLTCATAQAAQSATCESFCKPLTPNGCDCFGCCSLPGAPTAVWLGSRDANGVSTCTSLTAADPSKCHPCTKVASCDKPCGRCQLCIGKDTLPPDCYMSGGGDGGVSGGDGGVNRDGGSGGVDGGGGVPGQCPAGVQACGLPGQPACPPSWYCLTGCCIPSLG